MGWPKGRKRSSRSFGNRSISKRIFRGSANSNTPNPAIQDEIELASSPVDEIQVEAVNTDDQDEQQEEDEEQENSEEDEIEVEEIVTPRRGRRAKQQTSKARSRGRPKRRPRRTSVNV